MSVSDVASVGTLITLLGSSIFSVIIGLINREKIQEVHLSINSRMDELLREAKLAAHAAGAAHAAEAAQKVAAEVVKKEEIGSAKK